MEKKKTDWVAVAALALSALFLVGVLTVFAPCPPKEDGTWMHCHQAGLWEAGIGAVLTALALLRLVWKNRGGRLVGNVAAILLCVAAILLPGNLIQMCMMNTMRCHAVMTPAVRVFAVLILVLSAADAWTQRKRGTNP